ncbi:malto-oligosyltrehalose trehalohydrolase [Nocardioides litoris]|uniref:malto-oligosyltrehalose trehalohydrolase n=1 Tax=Nocardioides litoris TaxID=1926648 RepID=UPI00111FDD8E|nr:malto-oligosyltrehalose trehalohydrolase [Nocardioides litoris]
MAHPTPRRVRGPFDVWAPSASRLRLSVVDDIVEMQQSDGGWWTPSEPTPDPAKGDLDYGYLIDDADAPRPDPRSRRQPAGVHQRSRTHRPEAFSWSDDTWRGRQLAGAVVYELHVGTFTPEGTFDAAAAKLDHLRSVGVDLVELLPVNAVNGTHNWGYDGVLWSAVHEPYGGPEGYQRFVDAAHAAGLGVCQDVVYNHLGPSGNYLPEYGPYLKQGRNTWGDLVNLDGEGSTEVRRLILDNVRMWFEDFHVDALRLDAVHALHDESPVHLLEEMAVETAALSAHLGRPLTLIAESDLNDTRLVTPREGGGYGLDAQWSDDFHHAVHVALTGETTGYYADFEPLSALAKVVEKGFFHDGTYSSFRGRDHGAPVDTATMPTWRLVVCSQNHDQIGNRAVGDRLTEHLDEDQLACAALLVLTGPFTPMLFQGEEWGARTPFQFFTSHPEPELGEATAKGRIEEFAQMGWDPDVVPDPQDPATFERSKLDWSETTTERGERLLGVYRDLARLRREHEELTDPSFGATTCWYDEDARLFSMRRGRLEVVINLGDSEGTVPLQASGATGATGASPATLLFTTPSGAEVVDGGVRLPAHAGAVVATA